MSLSKKESLYESLWSMKGPIIFQEKSLTN